GGGVDYSFIHSLFAIGIEHCPGGLSASPARTLAQRHSISASLPAGVWQHSRAPYGGGSQTGADPCARPPASIPECVPSSTNRGGLPCLCARNTCCPLPGPCRA